MKRTALLIVAALLALANAPLVSQPKRAITFNDLIGFSRLGDPQVSPDGKMVVFVMTTQLVAENRSGSDLYLVPVAGGAPRQLTSAKGHNNNPRWMPDGKSIAFISTRDGSPQIWTIPVDGGEARKISNLAAGVSGVTVSPDGKWFAFATDVYPECPDLDCTEKRMAAEEASKVKAKVFTTLPYRVWNHWKDGKRSHLFVMPAGGGIPRDLTPGDYDTPPIDLGGAWDYAFSPDSKEVVFTRNPDPLVAISTNNELYVVPVAGGEIRRITDNPANDSQPLYSPDGKFIAYRKMRRPMFEADQRQLTLFDRVTGTHTVISGSVDLSVNDVVWLPSSKAIIFNADERGREAIYRLTLADRSAKPLLQSGMATQLRLTPDGKTLIFLHETINRPAELAAVNVDGSGFRLLTNLNGERLAALEMNPMEEFWFTGAEGAKVHGLLVKPPKFDQAKKYPMVFLVHGGPQGQWGDQFHYRWNAQMFASRGHVVVLINPRGSTGYGQQFTDEISGDWGGRVYEDLMNGLDAALKQFPFIDGNRIAAAGASYGGYMMNWFLGKTDRFACIVSHDGVFNPVSMYGTTEELWFPEWEFGGTPYQHPELFKKWSPLEKAKHFKTPTLVVHGQLDYRVDVSEGFQLFTALQRQGVKSKMLYFPDEGHFVAKPQNAELWYRTVLDWIEEHTQPRQN